MLKRFLKGFVYAAAGICRCVREERNFRFELCAGALVVWFGMRYFAFSGTQWAVLLLTVAAVLALEAVNSAIERAVAGPDAPHDAFAGQAKDMAAGAVLLVCCGAVGVGAALFWQPSVWKEIFCGWAQYPYRPVLLAGYLTGSAVFVFHR